MKIAGMILLVLVMGVLVWLGVEDVSDAHMFGETPEGKVCENLHAGQVAELIARKPDLMILDVRSGAEQQMGALDGAVYAGTGTEEFETLLAEMDKSQPILVYCSGGFRSRLAIQELQDAEFTELYHMNRGYLGWMVRDRSAGKDIAPEATAAETASPESPEADAPDTSLAKAEAAPEPEAKAEAPSEVAEKD